MNELYWLEEPTLTFGYDQQLEDPRDGLTLFGPRQDTSLFGVNYGLVGTKAGINRFYRWIASAMEFIAHPQPSSRDLWIPFPGFEEVFRVPFAQKASYEREINQDKLEEILTKEGDQYQRVSKVVDLYEEQIADIDKNADEPVSLWYVIAPESVYRECRPKSTIDDPTIKVSAPVLNLRKQRAKQWREGQGFLFEGQEGDYYAYEFDNDFRRQLKAKRLLNNARSPIQILRESTLTPDDFLDKYGARKRELQPESQVAWNLLSTTYYKAGGKPWKLSQVRKGVCYLGMVFKQLTELEGKKSSCCAAQMFLDSGDGVVFKGAVGPWKSGEREEYHLDADAAKDIITRAVEAYKDLSKTGEKPKEIFIHGRTYLNDNEWKGFSSVSVEGIKTVGVRIRHSDLRVFRPGKWPVLRGTAYIESSTKGYLWTTGFIPRLRTDPYHGFPRPLSIEVCQGEEDILTVLKDIYALTKLNYNSCFFGDGEPITLKFAEMIGDILTAGPIKKDEAPLPFKFYI